jgi:hypothetical protein
MRTRRLPTILVLALIASSSFAPASQAASAHDSERAPSLGLVAHFEQWLLGVIGHVEGILGLEAPATTPPTGATGSDQPSVQRECGSGIDPNGGCKP